MPAEETSYCQGNRFSYDIITIKVEGLDVEVIVAGVPSESWKTINEQKKFNELVNSLAGKIDIFQRKQYTKLTE